MKIRKTFLVVVVTILTTVLLTFSSLATENSNTIVDIPDSNTENTTNTENPDTNIGNDTDNENSNTNEDNNTGNDSNIDNNTNNEDKGNNPSNEVEQEQNKNEYVPPVEEPPLKTETPTYNNTTIEKELSNNTNLRELILDIEGLAPEFDKDITDYYLVVDLIVETINIEAYPEDDNSIVYIDGNADLQEGENTITITVKAESGDTKIYTINVTKTDDVDKVNANLKSLLVKGFNFYPSFKNNIYNYNLTISEKISQLEIIVEPEIEDATYEIIGNKNLIEGDNLIKIIVTSRDGTAKREYKLNVFISSKNVTLQDMENTPAIVLLSILGVAIIGTTIAIAKKK